VIVLSEHDESPLARNGPAVVPAGRIIRKYDPVTVPPAHEPGVIENNPSIRVGAAWAVGTHAGPAAIAPTATTAAAARMVNAM
jgi:hypothetical protein